jgi:hypothetical protein
MDLFNNIIDTTEQHLNILMDNIYLSTIIKVLLIMYSCIVAPTLPANILQLLDNVIIKILVVFAIIFLAKRDLGISLLIAIVFVVTLQLINKNKLINLTEIKKVIEGGGEVNNVENNNVADIYNEELSAIMPIDEQSSIIPTERTTIYNEIPSSMMPREEHISMIPREKHTSMMPREEQASMIPREEQASMMPIEEHTSMIPREEQASMMPREEQASLMPISDNCVEPLGFDSNLDFAIF